jgi:hypothetical protein
VKILDLWPDPHLQNQLTSVEVVVLSTFLDLDSGFFFNANLVFPNNRTEIGVTAIPAV